MNRYLLGVFAATISFSLSAVERSAQNAVSEQAQVDVALTKLFQPVYPPLARQARITGDVELALAVKADGSLESAIVVSGHPLLKQAALESAQRSKFECRDCALSVRSLHLFYSFQLGP